MQFVCTAVDSAHNNGTEPAPAGTGLMVN